MNGIDKMTALILSEAEDERAAKLKKAGEEADALLADYRKKADALSAAEAEKTAKEAGAILERAEASAHQIERNKLLEARGALLDRAYAGALDRLCSDSVASSPEYIAMLESIFDSVLAQELSAEKTAIENDPDGEYTAPQRYFLRLNDRDKGAIGAALGTYANGAAAKHGKSVEIDERIAPISGGFIMVCGDVELNCSIEQYVNKIRSATEGEVCGILFA